MKCGNSPRLEWHTSLRATNSTNALRTQVSPTLNRRNTTTSAFTNSVEPAVSSQLYHHLWKRTKQMTGCDVLVPDTIVITRTKSIVAYTYDRRKCYLVAKTASGVPYSKLCADWAQIEDGLGVMAHCIFTVESSASSQFLSADELFADPRFSWSDGVVQQFIAPKGEHNHQIRALWDDGILNVEQRTNVHSLRDNSIPVAHRLVCFDGDPSLSVLTECPLSISGRVEQACKSIAHHFLASEAKRVVRMELYFKIDFLDELWLLWGREPKTQWQRGPHLGVVRSLPTPALLRAGAGVPPDMLPLLVEADSRTVALSTTRPHSPSASTRTECGTSRAPSPLSVTQPGSPLSTRLGRQAFLPPVQSPILSRLGTAVSLSFDSDMASRTSRAQSVTSTEIPDSPFGRHYRSSPERRAPGTPGSPKPATRRDPAVNIPTSTVLRTLVTTALYELYYEMCAHFATRPKRRFTAMPSSIGAWQWGLSVHQVDQLLACLGLSPQQGEIEVYEALAPPEPWHRVKRWALQALDRIQTAQRGGYDDRF
eukprot:TRINITY_DN3067_c0_g1_i1.p1 TRINITY_DN3067_c0_g1~~TRINITY_DN3067_c0_g1_i1.p1  ORF type:complete len:538 (-),score=40.29 TRINITY_DN3067_c0_g1_i1:38-1651(-)